MQSKRYISPQVRVAWILDNGAVRLNIDGDGHQSVQDICHALIQEAGGDRQTAVVNINFYRYQETHGHSRDHGQLHYYLRAETAFEVQRGHRFRSIRRNFQRGSANGIDGSDL